MSRMLLREPYARRLLHRRMDATSYIVTEEIEEACQWAGEAFSIGVELRSDRVVNRVIKVRAQLAPWKDTQAVRALGERMMEGLVGGS
ncbi:MAG: hypothetical protein ACREIH_03280 [Nitrospiraceae bacterium]